MHPPSKKVTRFAVSWTNFQPHTQPSPGSTPTTRRWRSGSSTSRSTPRPVSGRSCRWVSQSAPHRAARRAWLSLAGRASLGFGSVPFHSIPFHSILSFPPPFRFAAARPLLRCVSLPSLAVHLPALTLKPQPRSLPPVLQSSPRPSSRPASGRSGGSTSGGPSAGSSGSRRTATRAAGRG
eukprot:SAG22_NODE_33_length_27588_cov_104.174652_23_plen_180_part_00